MTERDIERDEVCVTVSLGKESQRSREQKEWMLGVANKRATGIR